MNLQKDQNDISLQRGLPVELVSDSQHVVPVSEATVAFYYYNSGVYTIDAGQAAGVKVIAKLIQGGVLNSIGDVIGTKNDTSLAFTSTAFTTEVYVDPKIFEKWDTAAGTTKLTGILADAGITANGRYCVDYRTGTLFGIKASTQSTFTSCTYKIATQTAGGSSVSPGSVSLPSSSTSTRTTVTPALTSATLIAANASRKGLRIVHTAVDPTQQIWIAAAATATSAIFFTKLIGTSEVDLFDSVEWPYTGVYSLISDVATGTTQVYELT